MATQITAAQAQLITGRCAWHDSDLRLVPYVSEPLGSVLDAWYCPGWPRDPELQALHQEDRQLNEAHPRIKVAAVRARQAEIVAKTLALHGRCRDSWVLTVPDAVPGC